MHALIIGPIHSGLLYVDAAHELGASVSIITTNKDDYVIDEETISKVDELILVTDFSLGTLVDAANKLHQQTPVTAVAAGVEFLVTQTAHIAKALSVPGLDPALVDAVRNKAVMREKLQEAGVRTVRFAKANTAIDLDHVSAQVGFPAVVKPLDMAGSIGVVRVDNEIELLAAYEDIASDSKGWGDHIPGTEALLEQLLVGTEYCVDGYVTQDGEIHTFEFVKVELGEQPHFQEIGYTSYRYEDLECAHELSAYIESVVRAVGITVGPFHSEVMLTEDGPVLIEIASRLPGDHLPILTKRATGISFATCSLAALLGVDVPAPSDSIARVAASQFIISPEDAGRRYSEIAGWEQIVSDPRVDSAVYEVIPGSIIPAHQDMRSRIAEIQFHGDNAEEVEAFRQTIVETARIVRA